MSSTLTALPKLQSWDCSWFATSGPKRFTASRTGEPEIWRFNQPVWLPYVQLVKSHVHRNNRAKLSYYISYNISFMYSYIYTHIYNMIVLPGKVTTVSESPSALIWRSKFKSESALLWFWFFYICTPCDPIILMYCQSTAKKLSSSHVFTLPVTTLFERPSSNSTTSWFACTCHSSGENIGFCS